MVLAIPRVVDVLPRRRASDKDDPGPLAAILVRLRGERGWLQREVAPRAGFTQPYYSSLETGAIQMPGKEKLEALDRAFDLEPGTIRSWLRNGPPFRSLKEENGSYLAGPEWEIGEGGALIRILPRLSPEARRQIADYARYLADRENVS